MSDNVEFCAILTIRYLNHLLMGSAHDWVAANMPSEMPQGFLRSRSFHIAPDRGMTILWFDNQENLDNNIDLKIAENNKASKELLVKLEKSNALPTLNAYLNGSYSGFSNNFSFLEVECCL